MNAPQLKLMNSPQASIYRRSRRSLSTRMASPHLPQDGTTIRLTTSENTMRQQSTYTESTSASSFQYIGNTPQST